jgi:hypothetical protein
MRETAEKIEAQPAGNQVARCAPALEASPGRFDPRSVSPQQVLALQRSAGNGAVARMLAQGRAIQRYVEKTDSDGDPWRVSESGQSALWVKEAEGGQSLYASPELVKQANEKLANAGENGSFIRLKATHKKLKGGLLEGHSADVRRVEPRLVTIGPDPDNKKLQEINKGLRADDDGTDSKEFALWADCGRASRTVMGTDLSTGAKPAAHTKIGGAENVSAPSTSPASFTTVYKEAMPEFMKADDSRKFLKADVHYKKDTKWSWKDWKFHAREIMKDPVDDKDAKRLYWELGEDGRRAFDEQTGVNLGADPEIGGAYTLVTEREMPGFSTQGAKTWNFHWAGVVMKDGENNVTLENYAVSYGTSADPVENAKLQKQAYDEVNRSWVFQMYGTKQKGQTFHEQHLASGTHGTRGSTFAVKV